jgi:lactate 2-monooxygenase
MSKIPASSAALERSAELEVPKHAFAYLARGAGRETTIAANRRGFDCWQIVPNVLRDVSGCDTATTLLAGSLLARFCWLRSAY